MNFEPGTGFAHCPSIWTLQRITNIFSSKLARNCDICCSDWLNCYEAYIYRLYAIKLL